MDKYIYDKNDDLWYELQEDCYISCLILPAGEQRGGLWEQRHLRYLKEHRKVLYTNLLTSGKLNNYLADIDKQAQEMYLHLIDEMANRQGVTEQLKAENPMEWIEKMGVIQSCERELVNNN